MPAAADVDHLLRRAGFGGTVGRVAALAAQQLKNCTEARTYLDLVKKKYPKSNVTKQVNELDAALKRDLKNKATCSS